MYALLFAFRNKVNINGFTLVELIVVMAVSTTLSLLGIAAFVSFSHTQEMNSAQRDVVTMLETAKFRAQSQALPPSRSGPCLVPVGVPPLPPPLYGYSVDFTFSSGTYALYDHCGNSPVTDTEDSTVVQKKTLSPVSPASIIFPTPAPPGDSTAKVAGSNTTVFFPVISGGRGLSGDPASIVITISGYNQTRTITVFNDGRIVAP